MARAEKRFKLEKYDPLAEGMRAIFTMNLAVNAELANGTQGIIEKIYLDSREPPIPEEVCENNLHYPPSLLLFRPDRTTIQQLPGLSAGIIPIQLAECSIQLIDVSGAKATIHRRQLSITGGYAFTDYKSQGQTLVPVIVDIAKPPTGNLNQFNVYVAISRGQSREHMHILRKFDPYLFTRPPPIDLVIFDEKL